MRLPAVRYPLFWIVGLLAALGLFQLARPALDSLRTRLQARVVRAIEGPPVPSSHSPQVIAGALTRQGLLLETGVQVAARPGGTPTQTLSQRLFVDVYDVWPPDRPSHVRIGTRGPLGWVRREALLPWDTRLVVRSKEASGQPLPVLGWEGDRVEVALWSADGPWSRVERREWMDGGSIAERGVLLSRVEVAALVERLLAQPSDRQRNELRIRAILGRLLDADPITPEALIKTRKALPDWIEAEPSGRGASSLERLSELNAHWQADAAWNGLEFRLIPLGALP